MASDPATLFLVVDAVPFDVAAQAWDDGCLPGFERPRPMASVFPALTHVAVPALLSGAFPARPPGYEVRWLDPSGELRGGFGEPGAEAALDPFRVRPAGTLDHAAIYPLPGLAAWAQARWITRRFVEEGGAWLGYLWATDAVGHFQGCEALLGSFRDVCARVVEARLAREPDAEVVLCSDHGMRFGRLAHLDATDLAAHLEQAGFSPSAPRPARLVPFGDVSAGAVYCADEDAEDVARVLVGVPGVALAFARVGERVVVFGAEQGRASFERASSFPGGVAWRHTPDTGDPLGLAELGADWVPDDATRGEHLYPDALHRVWRGLHDLVDWPARVLFSMAPGHTYGPTWSHTAAEILGGQVGTHGALDRAPSLGFATTTRPGAWSRACLRPEEVLVPWRDLLRAGV